jgi:hypothetical protein
MSNRWLLSLLLVALTWLAPRLATAQSPTAAQSDSTAPTQLPAFSGKVEQFTLTPRGDIDGLILTDGTEVKTPPHLSTAVANAIRQGDEVTIRGLRAAAIPLLRASSITDNTTHRTVIDQGPASAPHGLPLGANGAGRQVVHGSVRMTLHGARGEINGVLLTDGTVLRLEPNAAVNLSTLLQPGNAVVAEGDEWLNTVGKVLDVRAMGTSQSNLVPINDAPPTGPRGRARPHGPDMSPPG